MGKHSSRKRSFFRRLRPIWYAVFAAVLLLAAALGIFFAQDSPCRRVLDRAGISYRSCKERNGVVFLAFDGDASGILTFRQALSALRSECAPGTVEWSLWEGEQQVRGGRLEHASSVVAPESSRVETLDAALTELKLKYELEQSGLSAEVKTASLTNPKGKAVRIVVETGPESLSGSLLSVSGAVSAVNGEGGGILRCDVLFQQNGILFAAASYDFIYGDILTSSLLSDAMTAGG